MSEQDQGFKVKDRRLYDDDGNLKQQQDQPETEQTTQAEPTAEQLDEAQAASETGKGSDMPLPPVDLPSLVLSLAHAAMMHLGQLTDPETGQAGQSNLPLARHAIDTIAMLKEKTKGNLTDEEQNILDNVLTDLRLAYVHMSK